MHFKNFSYDVISMENSNRIAKQFFGNDLPDLRDLAYKTNLFLVNSHFSINQARPTVPNFIEVGGLHINQPKPLPKVRLLLHKHRQYRMAFFCFAASRKCDSKQQ